MGSRKLLQAPSRRLPGVQGNDKNFALMARNGNSPGEDNLSLNGSIILLFHRLDAFVRQENPATKGTSFTETGLLQAD